MQLTINEYKQIKFTKITNNMKKLYMHVILHIVQVGKSSGYNFGVLFGAFVSINTQPSNLYNNNQYKNNDFFSKLIHNLSK